MSSVEVEWIGWQASATSSHPAIMRSVQFRGSSGGTITTNQLTRSDLGGRDRGLVMVSYAARVLGDPFDGCGPRSEVGADNDDDGSG